MTEDPDLVRLAMQIARQGDTEAATGAQPPLEAPSAEDHPPPLAETQANPGLKQQTTIKGKKSADELAAMILADLRGMKDCPKTGVNVTVYGSNPWNAWLSFGADAGPVRNKAEMQGICEIITDRLRRLYDISD